jgi:5-methyltetrahydrofolate--homocysteine methyltransferase
MKNPPPVAVPFRNLEEPVVDPRLRDLSQSVVARNFTAVVGLTEELTREGMDPFKILNEGLMPGMSEANARFRNREFYIPELLTSTMALRNGLGILAPLIRERRKTVLGRVVIGTVKFDLHDIGKDLVILVLENSGFDVINLGVNVSPEKFVKTVEKREAQILAISCLLTTTMTWMKATIELLHASGFHREVKTLVGGVPVTSLFARQIGADAYCQDATSAPHVIRGLLRVSD